ncbi:MAG TPA: DUF3618 domain-containing protein [Hyphomicrobiaceae bacterium]|nr:DUF3618 domain-containing protein [Hyphomicrobiaceae bacterium]
MPSNDTSKSSAQIERELDAQRNKIEARIGEIRERLSPGQLLDEALSYTKNGGAHFAANLGQQVSANPMPAALVGIGLAWLIASNTQKPVQSAPLPRAFDEDDYPYARISSGGLKRTGHSADDGGQWWSEFRTDAGQTFKAKANEAGERASHFTDETGKRFSGFIDDAGNRVRQFQDEAGNRLDDTLGWASHGWRDTQQSAMNAVNAAASGVSDMGNRVAQSAQTAASTVQAQSSQLSQQVADLFNQQPLVAGALAFAAGAAVGAMLPATAQEDALLGEQADKVREKATKTAGDLYEKGKQQVAEVYENATEAGSQIYEKAKDEIGNAGIETRH